VIDSDAVCRRSPPYRMFRRMAMMIAGALAAAAVGIAVGRPDKWPAAIAFGAFALLVGALFAWRLRSMVRRCAAVCDELDAIARAAFDGGAQVAAREDGHLETLASHPMFARAIARRSVRFVATGSWQGAPLEIGETVTASRDYNVTISHVRLGGRPRGQLRIMSRGLATRLSRWHREQHEVKTGDDAFDGGWVVDADDGLARDVLEPELRRALVALHGQIASMYVASIEATATGLVVRWPGPLSPARAVELRDLAATIAARACAAA
jgi:hypothetical protein